MSSDKNKKINIKMQREVEIVNFDNCGKILTAEKTLIDKFIKQRKPVLNREGNDIMAGQLNNLTTALFVVIKHLDIRIKELEKLNKEEKED